MNSSSSEYETERIEALYEYKILDSEAEPVFDNLVYLAANICETPVAVINLIHTEKHWFKSCIGWEEVKKEIPFCNFTISNPNLLIVTDSLEDERFEQNSFTIDGKLARFYAGVPLRNAAGYSVGTLCVLDYTPRFLSLKQIEVLKALGKQVMMILELRRNSINAQQKSEEIQQQGFSQTAEFIEINQRLESEVNQRQEIEKALQISHKYLSGIVDIADDAIISMDKEQNILLFNQGAEKIFGYTAAEVIGKSLDVLLPTRYHQTHRKYVVDFSKSNDRARRMGKRQEIFVRKKNGEEFPVEASISKLKLDKNIIFTAILRNIGEEKKSKEALLELSQKHELILNSIGEGLFGLDKSGKITFVNPAAISLLKYKKQELIGQNIDMLLANNPCIENPDADIECVVRKLKTQEVSNDIFRRKDGSVFPVEYIQNPILDKGKVVGAVIAFKDISDRQIIERMKDEFISVVSHELRTPLASIHGSLGILDRGLIDANSTKGKRLLHIAADSTARLVELVNNILDIERITYGKMKMHKQICEVSEIIVYAANKMQTMAQRYGVSLSISTVSAQIWADGDRIVQTLTNLLSNAIKFSTSGGNVYLSASICEDLETCIGEYKNLSEYSSRKYTGAYVSFQVKDEGCGIPNDKIGNIFDKFHQVDTSDTRKKEGSGLGLTICQYIVQQHLGKIWVESKLDRGSTFYLILPLHLYEE
ncbi:MAG: PAS domain S-box protein [Mastigocoleus sp. MO_167.B18]|nr:PAS domain S-box protein [Mastigocoleus sp. MO_167.B18]